MGSVRSSLIALVMIVASLAGVFDGCLLDCHPQALAALTQSHAHCHPAPPQPSGVRWQADGTCHHDHTAAAAESAMRTRLDSKPLGVAPSLQTVAAGFLTPISSSSMRSTGDRSGPVATLVPLRV